MERTSKKVAVLLGVLLMLALGAALLSSRSGPTAPAPAPSTPAHATAPSAAPSTAAAAPPKEFKPKQDILPIPGCWQGVAEFDAHASMDTFRAALAAAVASGDQTLATYLQERLTELVGDDAGRALQVLDWAKSSNQPELGVYMEALKQAPAVQRPEVVEGLLKMGEDKGATLVNRSAAMDTLETQKRLTPASMQRLKAIALDETVDSVGWVATRTLGRVMKEDYERTGTFAPYWKELLDIGEKSDDMAVRLLALEMPSYSDPIIGGDSVERLSKILRNDRERDVREMAAFRLAVTEEPQKALDAYRAAFPAEHEECVRWAIFRFAARAAGPQALPLLQQLAAQDPRFQADYEDFKRLYAEGTVDFARVWLGMQERHPCNGEEG